MKPLFDVVLIMRNEAKTLPRLLSSLEEFKARGGQVFITDTGSTDNSIQVAKDWGCHITEGGDGFVTTITKEQADVVNSRFVIDGEEPILKEGDRLFRFDEARNFAASLATQDVIAMPDADECYTTFDIDAINAAIKGGMELAEYQFVFAHDAQGLPTVQFTHAKFYDRRKLSWSGVIHEILRGDANRVYLPEHVIKLEHFQNAETNRSGYLRGLAYAAIYNSAAESPDRCAHYLSRECLYTGRYRSAIKGFEEHIAMNGWLPERAQSAVFIGQCYEALGDEEKAISSYHRALQIDASRREAWLRLARLYYKRGDHQRVASYIEASLAVPLSNFYSNNAEDYRHVPHELGYWAWYFLGDRAKAKEHFDKAWLFYPTHPKYFEESQFFYELPTVSFIIPSLRPEGLAKCLESIKNLNYPQDKIDICVLDAPEPTVPQKVAEGVAKTKGEYIVYAADDVEMTPDSLKIAILSSLVNKKALVAFHSEEVLPDEGNICAHFVIRRDFLPKINGQIFDTDFHHVGVDNLLWAKCKRLGEAYHESAARIIHNHFSKGADYDATYQRGWSHVEEDRALLARKLKALET